MTVLDKETDRVNTAYKLADIQVWTDHLELFLFQIYTFKNGMGGRVKFEKRNLQTKSCVSM